MEPPAASHLCCSISGEWPWYRRRRGQSEYVIVISPIPGSFYLYSELTLLSLQSRLYLLQRTEIRGVASYCSHRCSPATSHAPSAAHHRGANATTTTTTTTTTLAPLALGTPRRKWRKAGGAGRSAMARLKRSTMPREHASSRLLWRDWRATPGPGPNRPPLRRRPIHRRRGCVMCDVCPLFSPTGGAC